MAWNEPGGPKNNDPWGNKNNNEQGPPDLDEVIKNLNDKIGKLFGGKGGGSQGSSTGNNQPPTIIFVQPKTHGYLCTVFIHGTMLQCKEVAHDQAISLF